MKDRPLKARRPVAGERVDRITLSIASEDKTALGKIADEKKVSIAWVIRDAITKYLSEEPKKSEA
jgi:predicted transcriptional regulator